MSTLDDRDKLMLATLRAHAKSLEEITRLRGCLAAIQIATIKGRVCDDVAWFDTITTLHDYCEQALHPNR